jgi:hypothetical protein
MKRLGLLLTLALASSPACDKPVTYSYFLIDAKLDPATVGFSVKDVIEACAVTAQTPLREDVGDLHCRRHQVTNDLGTFEYTTSLTTGSIKFVLIAQDYNQQLVARGESMPLDIKLGQTVTGSVTAVAVPLASDMPDSGTAPPADSGASGD